MIARSKPSAHQSRFFICLLIGAFSLAGNCIYAETNQRDKDNGPIPTAHDIQRGKRLFHGLKKTENGRTINCASCHNVNYSDTLNWNPSAFEIANISANLDSIRFANVLNNPVTKHLNVVHNNFALSGEEIELLRHYLNKIKDIGTIKPRPNITRLLLFVILILLFGWSFSDLLIIKKVDKIYIHATILAITIIWITNILVYEGIRVGRSQGYSPAQPIKFSHKVHATDNKIDCNYCHHTAENSKSAGIPSTSLCLNCHTLVREGTNSGMFEINKIHTATDSMRPIEWIRVHRLPDFVFFSHAQHVNIGKLDCIECHGLVENMHVVRQNSDLSMGWCLDCHRTRKVNFIESEYYSLTFEDYHKKIAVGKIDSLTVEEIGGSDCMKCHY